MPAVYVTHLPQRLIWDEAFSKQHWAPTVDLAPATAFGELKIMLPHDAAFKAHPEERLIKSLKEALLQFKGEDFLLPLGDPIIMSAAAAILGARREPFQMLKWDRVLKRYSAHSIVP